MLKGKTVVLGVTGSIAAYKTASLASSLVKLHADVHVLMTQNATNFINPITFETLTGNKCLVDTFDRNFQFDVTHVSLAKKADVMLIAPASANVIGKIAGGIADDMLTTTVMASTAPVLISPAMNTHMYENPIVQDNLEKLRRFGYKIIAPAVGMLACRDVGAGKMPEPETLLEWILQEIACEKDLSGKKILITAGPTQESLDPVRYLTNHSTGKMGYALAKCAARRGAEVTLVTGPTALPPPLFAETVPVTTAEEMYQAVTSRAGTAGCRDYGGGCGGLSPHRNRRRKAKEKGRRCGDTADRTKDILAYLGQHKPEGQFLCGFSMETEHMLENSRAKLEKKHLDMICANNLKVDGAGFGTDTNVVTLIRKHSEQELPLQSKEMVSHAILDVIADALQ